MTIHKLNTTQKKQTTQNAAKQSNTGSVVSYETLPGNEMSLLYNAPKRLQSACMYDLNPRVIYMYARRIAHVGSKITDNKYALRKLGILFFFIRQHESKEL